MSETTESRDTLIAPWLAGLMEGLSAVRAPAVLAVVTVIALWLPEQVREVYRVLVQQRLGAEAALQWQTMFSIAALLLLSIFFWQIARELTHAASARRDLDRLPAAKVVMDWSPRVIATAPFVGAALGLWSSWLPVFEGKLPTELSGVIKDAQSLQSKLFYATFAAVALAVVIFVLITILERSILNVRPGRRLTETRGRRLFFINNWFLFPILGAISIIAFASYPILLPQYFGVIPIFALWMVITTVLASAGSRIYDVQRIPVLTIAIIAVIAFEFAGLSDNHRFRHSTDKTTPFDRQNVDAVFLDWLGSRKDAPAYRTAKKPYPVYVVAAEGGGIYAAYHAAKFLARMQDLCPNFGQHVFAVSSVSGGSLGAAVFSAMAQKKALNTETKPCKAAFDGPGEFERQAQEILSPDFLSPLIWSALFPDFVQRFLPVPIGRLDRAVALERSFEAAWDKLQGGDNPFRNSFFDLCAPGSGTCTMENVASPALLFNTTNVETGMQMVLSPLFFGYTGPLTKTVAIEDFNRSDERLSHMPLSTAVGLSARFPWVTPVGWHEFTVEEGTSAKKKQTRRMSFVDGGYFEGSGVGTAEKLAQFLDALVRKTRSADTDTAAPIKDLDIAINIIMVTGSYEPVARFFQTEQTITSVGEITTPLNTLLQAWRARSAALPTEVGFERREGRLIASSAQFDNHFLALPVGWQLADLSRKYLDVYTGQPQSCIPDLKPDNENVDPGVNANHCLVKKITDDLRPQ